MRQPHRLLVTRHAASRLKQRMKDNPEPGPFYEKMDPHEAWFLKSAIRERTMEGLVLTPKEWNRIAHLFYDHKDSKVSAIDHGWGVYVSTDKCYIIGPDTRRTDRLGEPVVKTTISPTKEQRAAIEAILAHTGRPPIVLPFGSPPYPAPWPCEIAILRPSSLVCGSPAWQRVRSWIRRTQVVPFGDTRFWYTPEFERLMPLLRNGVPGETRVILRPTRFQPPPVCIPFRTSHGITLILVTEQNVTTALRLLRSDVFAAATSLPTPDRTSRLSHGHVIALRERAQKLECCRFKL